MHWHSPHPIRRHKIVRDLHTRPHELEVPSAVLPRMAAMTLCNGCHAQASLLNQGQVLASWFHENRKNPARTRFRSREEVTRLRQK